MKGMVWSVQLYIGFYGLEYSNYTNDFLLCGKGKKNVDKKESSVPARKNMSHLLRLSRSGILWCNVSREEGEDPRRALVRCIVSFRQVAMVKRDLQARRPSEISSNETCVSVVPDFTNLGTRLPLGDDDVQNCSKTDPLLRDNWYKYYCCCCTSGR